MDNKSVETLEVSDTNNMKVDEPRKKSKVKVIIFLIVLMVIAGIGMFIYITDDNNTKQLEKVMEDASIDYYDKYASINSSTGAYGVTLEMLKEANSTKGENYKLDALDKCDTKTTKTVITIDYVSGEVTGTETTLNCKKF